MILCFQLSAFTVNFLEILEKSQINYFSKRSLDGYFNLSCNISLKSVPQQGWKIRRARHGAKHWKIWFFCIISTTTLTKAGCGGRGRLLYLIGKITKFLENQNLNCNQLCLHCIAVFIQHERENGSGKKKNLFIFNC